MRDNGSTGPALGPEAVDAQFWALICDDEEWLRTEFDEVVSDGGGGPDRAGTAPAGRHGPAPPGGETRVVGTRNRAAVAHRDATGQALAAGARSASRRTSPGRSSTTQSSANQPAPRDGDVIERVNDSDRRVTATRPPAPP
jgi:hypothetical protein